MTQDVVAALNAAIDPKDLRGLFPGDIADRLRQVFAGVIRDLLKDGLTPEQKQAILDGCKQFYDSVIRPIDIPYIPSFAEAMVDDWIWMAVESLARRLLQV